MESPLKKSWTNDRLLWWTPFIALLILHLFFNWPSNLISVFPDEAIQLSHARYLSGGQAFIFVGDAYSNFGYALLLVPLFWLFDSPEIIYRGAMTINALLMSSLYFSLFYIIRHFLADKKNTAALLALLASLYPSFYMTTHIVWSENLLIPLFTLSVALLLRALKNNTYSSWVYWAISIGFLYVVHIRTLAIVIATVVFLVVLYFYKRINIIKLVSALIVIFLIYGLSGLANSHLLSVAWQQTHVFSPWEIFTRFRYFTNFVATIAGQLWYLIQATYGLFVVAWIYTLVIFYKKFKKDKLALIKSNRAWMIFFVFLSFLSSFALSSLAMTKRNVPVEILRSDPLIYGRYNEIFIALFVLAGLFYFYKFRVRKLYLYISLGLSLLTSSLLLTRASILEKGHTMISNISGIIFWDMIFGGIKVLTIFIVTAIFISLVFYLFNVELKKGYYLVAALFLVMIMSSYYYVISRDTYKAIDLVKPIRQLEITELSYNRFHDDCGASTYEIGRSISRVNYYSFQFMLPNTKVLAFDSSFGQEPSAEYVVAAVCWVPSNDLDFEQLAVDRFSEQALWKMVK